MKMKRPLLSTKQSAPMMNDAKITITLYLFAMIISWTTSNVYGTTTLHSVNLEQNLNLQILEQYKTQILRNDKIDTLCPTYGIFLSLIFYARTKQARIEWLNILHNILIVLGLTKQIDKVERVSEVERISESELTTRTSRIENIDEEDIL
jgi:hypothetical protein